MLPRAFGPIFALLFALPTALAAQGQPPSCVAPEYRQFDFWIGTWDVLNTNGVQIGTNTITQELNGCVLHEHWEAIGGAHRGQSFNIYDRSGKQWHQTWVANNGNLLLLNGGLRGGKMVLEGQSTRPDGTHASDRITWSRETDGSVRQLWEQSTDGGATWTVAFDGRYVKR